MTGEEKTIKIALPKGHLFDSTLELLEKSGIHLMLSERNYKPASNCPDFEFRIVKPRNIPKMVEMGMVDVGIIGLDLIEDEKAKVNLVLDLKTMPVHLVVAGLNRKDYDKSKTQSQQAEEYERAFPKAIEFLVFPLTSIVTASYGVCAQRKQSQLVIASEYSEITKKHFSGKKEFQLLKTYGSTECFVPEFADVIVDHVQSGASLRENNLQILEIIMSSTTHLVANTNLDILKYRKVLELKDKLAEGLKKVDLSYPNFLTREQIIEQIERAK